MDFQGKITKQTFEQIKRKFIKIKILFKKLTKTFFCSDRVFLLLQGKFLEISR